MWLSLEDALGRRAKGPTPGGGDCRDREELRRGSTGRRGGLRGGVREKRGLKMGRSLEGSRGSVKGGGSRRGIGGAEDLEGAGAEAQGGVLEEQGSGGLEAGPLNGTNFIEGL